MDRPEEDLELTPMEHEALGSLEREREVSELLEERVVRALRAEGIVRPRPDRGSDLRRTPSRRGAWVAGIALFLAGAMLGHVLGARTTADAFLAVRQQDAALEVQAAGTAYVEALVALERLRREGGHSEVLGQGTQVATATMHAAAEALARLDPEDPIAQLTVQLLNERMARAVGRPAFEGQTVSF